MKMYFLFVFIFIFVVTSSFAVEGLKSSSITCLTSKCHSDLTEQKFLHSPIKAKGCIACHQIVDPSLKDKKLSKSHPSIEVTMGKNQTTVCLKCHVEWGTKFNSKQFPHSAIQEKGCTACHNPHGADNKLLLKEVNFNQELCLSCHKKNDNWEKGEKETTHRAINVKSKCLNCHEVHSAKSAKLLKESPDKLCLKCHEEIIETKDKGSLHTPVRNGECSKCHSPHYSSKENLLSINYEKESYVASVEASFELCFKCHTPFKNTKFRNGDKNLHEFHVKNKEMNKGKERGCSSCHAVHGSTQSMQILNKFSYGKYSLPMIFIKTEQGGNCTTACHGNKVYDRMNAVLNTEGR